MKNKKIEDYEIYVGQCESVKLKVNKLLSNYGYPWNNGCFNSQIVGPYWRIGYFQPNKLSHGRIRDEKYDLINAESNIDELIQVLENEKKKMNTEKFEINVGHSIVIKRLVEDLLYQYGYYWTGYGLDKKHIGLESTGSYWTIGIFEPNAITQSSDKWLADNISRLNASKNINELIEFLENNQKPSLPTINGYNGEYNKETGKIKYGCVEVTRQNLMKIYTEITGFNEVSETIINAVKIEKNCIEVSLETIKSILEVTKR